MEEVKKETFEFECLICSDKCELPIEIKNDKKKWYKVTNSDNLGSVYKGGIEIKPGLEKLIKYEYVELKCNHSFHSQCFIESEKNRKKTPENYNISYMCPYCRTTEIYVKPLIIKKEIQIVEDNNNVINNDNKVTKCKAKTKNGKDCVNKALNKCEYCGIHNKKVNE
jgi:hypothetical protein